MFAAVGKTVVYLKRIAMGPLTLDPDLEPGEYRELTEEEVTLLKQATSMQ
jgi:16S rRNA pseudouridine516 synthase